MPDIDAEEGRLDRWAAGIITHVRELTGFPADQVAPL